MSGTPSIAFALVVMLALTLACNLGVPAPGSQGGDSAQEVTSPAVELTAEAPPPAGPTSTPAVIHTATPSDSVPSGMLVYDVTSMDTAPERRAPYGDSYDINRLERPFLQDMTYQPGLDIYTYSVGQDGNWFYVTIQLMGGDPNDKLGTDFGVELDKDHDGFGDSLIWAHGPYPTDWNTSPVEIYQDTNHDTGGLSAEKSDAPIDTNGYDSLVFHGGVGDADPDIAWVRVTGSSQPTVQFAFKKSWSGTVFMLGVIAAAGLKDPGQLDYVDRFTIEQAGSPVRTNPHYPLQALYAVDNVCREAFGFDATGYEPQLCPREEPQPTKKPKSEPQEPPPPGGHCLKSCLPGYTQQPYPDCSCIAIIH